MIRHKIFCWIFLSAAAVGAGACAAKPEADGGNGDVGIDIDVPGRNGGCLGDNSGDVDVFVFEDDGLGRLDTWQRCRLEKNVLVAATSGDKKIVALSGAAFDDENWYSIDSYESLALRPLLISKELLERPVMSGEAFVSGDVDKKGRITLVPNCAKVCLETLCVDFIGRPYEKSPLKDIKVYLTNVSGRTEMIPTASRAPSIIYNCGGLSETDMKEMRDPSVLMREIKEDIGVVPTATGIELLCYDNDIAEESPGRPFTRLVIEGKIDGRTYYYPLDIPNLVRGRKYVFNLCITRTGTDDPDTPVSKDHIRILNTIEDWGNGADKTEKF